MNDKEKEGEKVAEPGCMILKPERVFAQGWELNEPKLAN